MHARLPNKGAAVVVTSISGNNFRIISPSCLVRPACSDNAEYSFLQKKTAY